MAIGHSKIRQPSSTNSSFFHKKKKPFHDNHLVIDDKIYVPLILNQLTQWVVHGVLCLEGKHDDYHKILAMTFNLVIAIGHNKSCTAFCCKGSLAGPEGNTDIHLKHSVVKDSHEHI